MVNKQLHILPYILKSKGNQTMKSGQLIEYTMGNVLLLKKSYMKYGGKTSPRHFSKRSKLSISLDQRYKVLCSLFYCVPKSWATKYIETKVQATCSYII